MVLSPADLHQISSPGCAGKYNAYNPYCYCTSVNKVDVKYEKLPIHKIANSKWARVFFFLNTIEY